VVKTVDQVEPMLRRIIATMKRRQALMAAIGAKEIETYNRRVDEQNRLERIVVLMDELSVFVGLGALTEEIHNLMTGITSLGRAVGVHLVAATQRPEVKVIPGRIKDNMIRMSGYAQSIMASMAILDNPEAARLPMVAGRFAIVTSKSMHTIIVQTPYMTDEDIQGVVSSAKATYTDVANDLSDSTGSPAPKVWDEQRVLKSCLDWLNGHLSGQRLHQRLGSESPGERHLAKVCRSIRDDFEAVGFVLLVEDGSRWMLKQVKRGWYLHPLSDEPDNQDVEYSAI
jgi:DNA segregation ATPase FtsK/SpoIIIE-like protein